MALDPLPTGAEIESVREAALLTSFALTQTLVNKLNQATWESLRIILQTEWPDIRHDDVQLNGRVRLDPDSTRGLFSRDIRLMLGLSPWPEYDWWMLPSAGPTKTVVTF